MIVRVLYHFGKLQAQKLIIESLSSCSRASESIVFMGNNDVVE